MFLYSGHRRTGSHGNVPVVASASGTTALPGSGDAMHRMTTAPGNLEDIGSHFMLNNINAARSVSWAPGYSWTPKQGNVNVVYLSGYETSIYIAC